MLLAESCSAHPEDEESDKQKPDNEPGESGMTLD
jgi:hypothetical protein